MTLEQIWSIRMNGKRPASVILASLVGPLREDCLVLDEPTLAGADFRCLVNCSVCLVVDYRTPNKIARRASEAILRCAPNGGYAAFSRETGYLWRLNLDTEQLDMLTWSAPMNLSALNLGVQPERFEQHTLPRGLRQQALRNTFNAIERKTP